MEIERLRVEIQPWHHEHGFTEIHMTVWAGGEDARHVKFVVPPHDFESLFDVLMSRAIEELRQHFTTKGAE